MNKRIQQLAEQALQLVADEHANGDESRLNLASYTVKDLIQEKFAELIVRECVQVCEPILDEPYEDMTEFGKGLVEGQDVAIERIKEHFGVE
jgi:hypothetical protein